MSGSVADRLLNRVRAGEVPAPEELLSFLSIPEGSARAKQFAALSAAFAEAGNASQAAVLAERAYIVSRFDEPYLDRCVELLAKCGDIDGLRNVLKRAGIEAANEGRIPEAIDLFNRSLYAFATHLQCDRYVYDFEMLAAIEGMAAPYRKPARAHAVGQRSRIAVLVFGAVHTGSVIVRILATFAQHADRSRHELAFFVPEASRAISRSASAREQVAALERGGWSTYVPRSSDPLEIMVETAQAIHEWTPDVLLTSALCADLRHYFIASTRPAPRIVGLVLGPIPQFTASWLDWNIAVSAHPAMDVPGNCSVVPFEFTPPTKSDLKVEMRENLGLQPGEKVIASAGRSNKFESGDFWRAIAQLMSRHPDCCYMAIGLDALPDVALASLQGSQKDRIRLVTWRDDYLRILALADILIDTYPSGGGIALLDAMALGIPTVSMTNDFLHSFDQTDWSLGSEFVEIPELVAARHDFSGLVSIVSRLLTNEVERLRLGRECAALMRARRGAPERMIRGWEAVFKKVVELPASSVRPGTTLHIPVAQAIRTGRVYRWLRRISRGIR